MTRLLRCFALALTLPLTSIDAQETPAVGTGSRVRVTYDEYGLHTRRFVGTLESIDSATIVLRRDNGDSIHVPRLPNTRLELSAGPGSCSGDRRSGCVALGFLGGAAAGVLAGLAGGGAGGCSDCGNVLFFLLTVPAGAVVGTIIGAVVGGEHWEAVLPPVRVGLQPNGPGRVALGVSVQF